MNNLEFIKKSFNSESRLEKRFNSLFKDNDSNVYSYNYHYPLLFRASDNKTLAFINTTGYSNTTSKHIGHAWTATDHKAIGIKLNGKRLHPSFTMKDALTLLEGERDDLLKDMESKKRKDTQVYQRLEWLLERVNTSIATVKDAM